MHPHLAAARDRFQLGGWDVLEAAARRGDELVAAHPGADEVSAAWRHSGEILRRGLLFKQADRPGWRVAATAFPLPAARMKEIERLGEAAGRFLSAVPTALLSGGWLRGFLGFPSWPAEESLLPFASRQPISFFRLDLTPDRDGRLRLLEMQTVSGGLGITAGLRDVYGPHPGLPGIGPALGEALGAGWRDWCAATGRRAREPLRLAALLGSESDFRHEMLVLASALPASVRMTLTPWIRLTAPAGVTAAQAAEADEGPDALFRFFQTGRLLTNESAWARTLVAQVSAGERCMLNPWIDALDDKRLLAAVHREEVGPELGASVSADDLALLRAAVPPTSVLDAELASRLSNRPRAERGWYLKKGRSAMSKFVVDGQQVNRGAFDRCLAAAVAEGGWVAQEAVRGEPWRFRWLDAEAGELRDMDGYVRLMPVFTRKADGSGFRLADLCITARPQRSRVHGASDACLVVPGPGQ